MANPVNFFAGARRILKSTGEPLNGYVYFYEVETVVAKDTFTTSALATANANPVALTDGKPATGIWFTGDIRFRAYDALIGDGGVLIDEEDHLNRSETGETSTGASGNEVDNGSFESADADTDIPTNWDIYDKNGVLFAAATSIVGTYPEVDKPADASDDQVHGANSLKFTTADAALISGGYAIMSNFKPVSKLRDYVLQFGLICQNATSRQRITVIEYDKDQVPTTTTIVAYDASASLPTSWTQKNAEVLIASWDTATRFYKLKIEGMVAGTGAGALTSRFDDVVFKQKEIFSTLSVIGTTALNDDVTIASGKKLTLGGNPAAALEAIPRQYLNGQNVPYVYSSWTCANDASGVHPNTSIAVGIGVTYKTGVAFTAAGATFQVRRSAAGIFQVQVPTGQSALTYMIGVTLLAYGVGPAFHWVALPAGGATFEISMFDDAGAASDEGFQLTIMKIPTA